MAEWSNAPVLKTGRVNSPRGFESLPLRHRAQLGWSYFPPKLSFGSQTNSLQKLSEVVQLSWTSYRDELCGVKKNQHWFFFIFNLFKTFNENVRSYKPTHWLHLHRDMLVPQLRVLPHLSSRHRTEVYDRRSTDEL